MRLITPDDNAHGRWVSNLVNLEVFDVSNWKVLAGESLDMGAFSYQTLGLTLAGGTLTSSTGPATLTIPSATLGGGLIDGAVTLAGPGTATQNQGTTLLAGKITMPTVSVTGGSLLLAGIQAGAPATITGTTTVASGGTFGGIGFAGSTTVNAGTLVAGLPASAGLGGAIGGPLNIQGTLALNGAATVQLQAMPAGLSSISVSGTATVSSSTGLAITFAPGIYTVGARTAVLTTATNGLSGTFLGGFVQLCGHQRRAAVELQCAERLCNLRPGAHSDIAGGSNYERHPCGQRAQCGHSRRRDACRPPFRASICNRLRRWRRNSIRRPGKRALQRPR